MIGLVTIGQSPREDILMDIGSMLRNYSYIEIGVLDSFSKDFIVRNLVPKEDGEFYVTRLRDGSEVRISKNFIDNRINQVIKSIEDTVDVVVILCTGDFNIESSKPIIQPGKIMIKLVEAMNIQRIAIFIPSCKQRDMVLKRWEKVANVINVFCWSPYSNSITELEKLAREIDSVDLVVMDCIGYSLHHKEIVKKYSGKPVIIPRTLAIAIAINLL